MIWRPMQDTQAQGTLGRVLESWEGTPYLPGQQRKGAGADCVRFVGGVLDELLGRTTDLVTIPPDTCLHDPAKSALATERLAALYDANEVTDGFMEPGDVIVTGPKNGGPGHVMIVGHRRNTAWHAWRPAVHWTGLRGLYGVGHRVFRVYRLRSRDWR